MKESKAKICEELNKIKASIIDIHERQYSNQNL